MILDDADKRFFFVGCRSPARLVVLDTNSGRIVVTLPTVGDTDNVFCETVRQQIYVIGGEGARKCFDSVKQTIMRASEEGRRRQALALVSSCQNPVALVYTIDKNQEKTQLTDPKQADRCDHLVIFRHYNYLLDCRFAEICP
jgi:hypothetical protein